MWLGCISLDLCPHLPSLCCKINLKNTSYGSPCNGNPRESDQSTTVPKKSRPIRYSSWDHGTIHPKLGSGVSSTILQGAVVVSQRGQIEEGVDQQQQQQRQHQRQAPVVGDQNLVAASLQEGAVPRHVRHTHTRPNDASTILC